VGSSTTTVEGRIDLFNLFISCQAPKLYDLLDSLSRKEDASLGSQLVNLRGYPHNLDLPLFLSVNLDSSSPPVVQFIAIEQNSFLVPISDRFFNGVRLILKHKVKNSPLIVFGWSDSWDQAKSLMSSNVLAEPPSVIISINGTVALDDFSSFLFILYSNLYLGIEPAVELALAARLRSQIKLVVSLHSFPYKSKDSALPLIRERDSTQITASLSALSNKLPFRLRNLKRYSSSFVTVLIDSESLIFVFAFDSIAALEQFEEEFSVKLVRGVSIHSDGSFDVSIQEESSFSFRTYSKEEVLTERWTMKSEAGWEWKQLAELFAVPGVKFIREIVDETNIVFEGTFFAKSVLESDRGFSVMMDHLSQEPAVDPSENGTPPLIR